MTDRYKLFGSVLGASFLEVCCFLAVDAHGLGSCCSYDHFCDLESFCLPLISDHGLCLISKHLVTKHLVSSLCSLFLLEMAGKTCTAVVRWRGEAIIIHILRVDIHL